MRVHVNDRTKTLLTIYGPAMILSLGTGMTVPAIPLLAANFDVSIGLAAQVVTAQMLGRLVFVLPAGMVVDQIGTKPSMIIGPALLSTAALASGFAPRFELLLLAVFLQGAGASLWTVAREVAVVDIVRANQRGRAMSAFIGVGQIGTTVGPVLGGVISDLLGYRALFVAYALLGMTVMAVSFTLSGVRRERPKRSGFLDFGRLSDIEPAFRLTFVVLIFATFCMMFRGTVFSSMVPLYVSVELGYSATEVGSLFGIVGLINVLMIVPSGFLSDKFGRKMATVPAAALTSLSFLMFTVADNLLLLSIAAAIQGLGLGFALGSMTTSTYDIAPEGSAAKFQSLRRFSAELGTLAGPPMAGALAAVYALQGVFLVVALLFFFSASLLAFVAKETHPERRDSRAPVPRPETG